MIDDGNPGYLYLIIIERAFAVANCVWCWGIGSQAGLT